MKGYIYISNYDHASENDEEEESIPSTIGSQLFETLKIVSSERVSPNFNSVARTLWTCVLMET
jgi:hypothetical protein